MRLYGARVSLSWTSMDALCRGTARWTGANSLDSVGVTPAAGGGFRSSDQLFYGSLAVLGFLLIQSLSSGFVVSCSTTPSVCLTCCGAEALIVSHLALPGNRHGTGSGLSNVLSLIDLVLNVDIR